MTKIISWNINSIRARLHLLKKLVSDTKADIICLQETKVINDLFPYQAIKSLGYEHIFIQGMKSYNGVAILSKIPFSYHEVIDICHKSDARHIYVTLQNSNIEIHNIYIPAGGDIADPLLNSKFDHKLNFLKLTTDWFKTHRNKDHKSILLGDLNIAPLPNDVWSHKQLMKVVSHTPIEIEHLKKLQESCAWYDAIRAPIPEDQKLYTWWSYRNKDWKKSNRGRRLDHIWVTPTLQSQIESSSILTCARDWLKCSDHVPVLLQLKG